VADEDAVDHADEVALEGSEGFAAGLALGDAAREIGAGRRMDACLGDGDDVQRPVEPSVA